MYLIVQHKLNIMPLGLSRLSSDHVQIEYILSRECVLLEYLNGVVWASVIRIFQLPEHSLVPMSLDKQRSNVLMYKLQVLMYPMSDWYRWYDLRLSLKGGTY